MASHSENWTIGVEEEYQIIDPRTRSLCADADLLLCHASSPWRAMMHTELQRSQVEISTPICQTLAEIRTTLFQARQSVITAAATARRWIAAAGTHPFSRWNEQQITASPRYLSMAQKYQQLAREQVIFGCHVHIGCSDREMALQIMNRARNWLAPILALTSNSPFWQGTDTGYASFRTQIWWRWPMAGPPRSFADLTDYTELIQTLVATGSIEDTTHIYWDIRLSERFPTIEFRVMDVCMTVDETEMVVGLLRALVQTCYEQVQQNIPAPHIHPEVLRAAHWRAARYGLEEDLIDAQRGCTVPAYQLINHFLDTVRPALEKNDEWETISSHVQTVLQQGSGAARQRAVYRQTGHLEDVVDFIVQQTAQGSSL